MRLNFLLMASMFAFGACNSSEKVVKMESPKSADAHSAARINEISVKHLDLDLNVDFEAKQISGTANWTLLRNSAADTVYFDVRNLNIKSVADEQGNALPFKIEEEKPFIGAPLKVAVGENVKNVIITYNTTEGAEALQWLSPIQTAGKVHPFLFTQAQAILGRTWIPCQDSPGIRFTYNAKVQVPKELMAVMSATNDTVKNETGIYNFKMEKPIPAYLIALSVGDLVFKPVGPRTGIFAEPSIIDAAVYEFVDMEKMLVTAEELYGEYVWDRYDLIVLPPSFPFGGMENPMLTFATPTILAGDRSLTALVAHELAHSWSGNLVTNANWNDFWLNEGFTVYFERRIMEAIYGKPYAEMLEHLGFQDLQETLEELGPTSQETCLKLDLEGKNPDDGLTDIAYEKGYFLLRTLEDAVGRTEFDNFLKTYFNKHAFQTITTEAFLAYLTENLFGGDSTKLNELKVNDWVYKPGLPSNCPATKSELFTKVDSIVSGFNTSGTVALAATKSWSTHEWLHFIRTLTPTVNLAQVEKLDALFNFTNSGNAEILGAWFTLTARIGYSKADQKMEEFLVKVGRRKFLTPIYKALLQRPDGQALAKSIYEKARPNYHSVAVNTMDQLLGVQ